MSLYSASAGLYMLASTLVHPVLCVLAWVLLGKVLRKRLLSYRPWLVASAVGSTLTSCAILLLALVTYLGWRDYTLAGVSYLFSLAGMVFSVIAFARLWRLIANLTPGEGERAQRDDLPTEEGVWPPRPRV